MTLAEQTKRADLIAEKISITATKITSGAAELATLIAGCARTQTASTTSTYFAPAA